MRILVAEDEENIARTYELVLQDRGHHVTVTPNGKECLAEYRAKRDTPDRYEVVILDYRMPVMDGYDAAKQILKLDPAQRVIFASAFAEETLLGLVKQNGMIAEILQKPFELEVLVNAVEDTELYSRLQKLKVNIGDLKEWNPSHQQLSDLLAALLRFKDAKKVFDQLEAASASAGDSKSKTGTLSEDSRIANAIIQEALKYLGPDWMTVFYYHLGTFGVHKDQIAENPDKFNEALEKVLGTASGLLRSQILQAVDSNHDLVLRSKVLSRFRSALVEGVPAVSATDAKKSGGRHK
jgi:CheY-like chemotaxis protein